MHQRAPSGESQTGDGVQTSRDHSAGAGHRRDTLRQVPPAVRDRQGYIV